VRTTTQTDWQDGDERLAEFIGACEAGDLLTVRKLAAQVTNVDLAGPSGRTGLAAAAAKNRIEIMRFLLEQGADPNKANANGTTPLMFAKTAAFAYGDCTAMRVLLDAGADKNARDKNGLTALDYTVRNSAMVIKFLEKY